MLIGITIGTVIEFKISMFLYTFYIILSLNGNVSNPGKVLSLGCQFDLFIFSYLIEFNEGT